MLILSDSHRRVDLLTSIISHHLDADVITFLGDGINDFEEAVNNNSFALKTDDNRKIISVLGNWDTYGREGHHLVEFIGGVHFYITHGSEERIRIGKWRLVDAAKENHCTVALYGHTHIAEDAVYDGVRLINPGAVKDGQYGILEILDEGNAVKYTQKRV